jgi:hypothetical protein
MDVARIVREARRGAGLSQSALAQRAKTSQPAVARYEAGTATPSLATLERLLAACGVDLLRTEAGGAGIPAAGPTKGPRGGRRARVRAARGKLLQAARRHGIRRVRLFGSVGRDEDTRTSDVDLLVDLAPGRTLLDLIGFQQEAEGILGVPVDAATPDILKERVRTRVLREARAL